MRTPIQRIAKYVRLFILSLVTDRIPQEPFGTDGISEFDSQLARFRVLLEKKWGHDHDNSVTYFPPDGSYSLPLTPYMLKEWA